MRGRRMSAVLMSATLALSMAACGDDDEPTTTASGGQAQATTTAAPGHPAPRTTTAARAPPVHRPLSVGTHPRERQRQVPYTWDRDTSATSTCTGGCATTWPRCVVAAGATAPVAGPCVSGLPPRPGPTTPPRCRWCGTASRSTRRRPTPRRLRSRATAGRNGTCQGVAPRGRAGNPGAGPESSSSYGLVDRPTELGGLAAGDVPPVGVLNVRVVPLRSALAVISATTWSSEAEHVVDVEQEGTARHLQELAEEPQDPLVTPVLAGECAAAADVAHTMPRRTGQRPSHVNLGEGLVAAADQLLVGMQPRPSLCLPTRRNTAASMGRASSSIASSDAWRSSGRATQDALELFARPLCQRLPQIAVAPKRPALSVFLGETLSPSQDDGAGRRCGDRPAADRVSQPSNVGHLERRAGRCRGGRSRGCGAPPGRWPRGHMEAVLVSTRSARRRMSAASSTTRARARSPARPRNRRRRAGRRSPPRAGALFSATRGEDDGEGAALAHRRLDADLSAHASTMEDTM